MTSNFTKGSPMRLLLSFTIPTLCGMLFQQLYNLIDSMIVGKLLGADALGSVGCVGSINFCVIGFCMGVCSGFAIPVAQRMGAGDHEGLRRFVANAVWLSVGMSIVLTVATGLFCRDILTIMNTPSDLFEGAYAYIFVIFMGIPTVFLYNVPAGILRSLGDSRTPVFFLALSSLLNIGLDLFFILVCGAGIAGAAIATVISQGISGLACVIYMGRKFDILRITREERRFDGRYCRELCMMGLPMGLQYSVTAIGSLVMQAAVNGLGSTYVTAVTAASKVSQLLVCPFDAMGAAMTTYCGQNVGAGQLDRLGRGIRDCTVLGLAYSALALGGILLFSGQAVMLFLDPEEELLALLVQLSSKYLMTLVKFYFPLALIYILRFSIQGMGFSALAILAGVFEMIARTVIGYVYVPAHGFDAACYASPVAWVCADLFLIPACAACIAHLRRRELRGSGRGGAVQRRHMLPRHRARAAR